MSDKQNQTVMKTREYWVDNTKVFACFLVVIGHFWMSMVGSSIVPETACYQWFIATIYYFHVPLFFICSGYLYQKLNRSNTLHQRLRTIYKKIVCLGIPYVTFTLITWIFKAVFSGEVNIANEGLLRTFFVSPEAPYWYLYSLILIFTVTPTFETKGKAVIGLICAIVCKILSFFVDVPVLPYVLKYEIWFVLGITMEKYEVLTIIPLKKLRNTGVILATMFLALSIPGATMFSSNQFVKFIMGILGCGASIVLFVSFTNPEKWSGYLAFLSQYTMPIFLMHTIFAAGVRIVLMKIGITSGLIHVTLGLPAGFVGPIIATRVMKMLGLDVLIWPGRLLKSHK